MLERNPALNPKDIRAILMTTAKPLAGLRSDFGAGLVNAYRAVTLSDSKSVGKNDGDEQAKR
jgi:hypothetical protein